MITVIQAVDGVHKKHTNDKEMVVMATQTAALSVGACRSDAILVSEATNLPRYIRMILTCLVGHFAIIDSCFISRLRGFLYMVD